MKRPVILLVEDNPVTRKLVRLTLEKEGYDLREAAEGCVALVQVGTYTPDLILLDLQLPDMDGMEILARLRDRPELAATPILAFSGFLSRLEYGRATTRGFTDLLAKPVEPSRLLQIVRSYLPAQEPAAAAAGPQRRVLVVDDDPVQLKLMRLRLLEVGFEVTTAGNGAEALERARTTPPEAVLSDVLMPGTDGFQLCAQLRGDPRTADLPIVLISSNYVEPGDRDLALRLGADALLMRTPDLDGAILALREALGRDRPRPRPAADESTLRQHHDRVMNQLDRQSALNVTLVQRTATNAAMLSLVAGILDSLARRQDLLAALPDVLATLLDASGLSRGALWLPDGNGVPDLARLVLRGQVGLEGADLTAADLFGKHALPINLFDSHRPVVVPAEAIPEALSARFLTRIQAQSALVIPIVIGAGRTGLLLLASSQRNLTHPDWLPFARTIGSQVGQSITLAETFAQLTRSEERFRQIAETIREVFWVFDVATGEVQYVSPASTEVWGRTPEELRARPDAWAEVIHPEDMDRVRLAAARMKETGEMDEVFRLRHRDGSVRWVHDRGFAVRDPGGRLVRLIGLAEDITRVKEAEAAQALAERKFRHAQKLEAFGQLAGGVAHDFNNLLTVISGYVQLVQMRTDPRDPTQPMLKEVAQAAERATGLTRQLLAFSRKQSLQPKVVDLNGLVAGVEKMLRRLIGEDIKLVTSLSPVAGAVLVDPGQIDQVLMNLAVNARDAMPRGGTLTIETVAAELGADDPLLAHEGRPGPYAIIAVGDTGSGMTEEVKARLFEPFFTTKEIGRGTGLGLATVYGIVKQSGGTIAVYSELGRGTTFKVYLPRVDRAPESVGPAEAVSSARGTETILVVEDEDGVRNLICGFLRSNGYRILEARNGGEALLLCERHADRIDLVMTDVVMPLMSGPDLVARLKKLRPGLRVLFMSGYPQTAATAQGVPVGDAPLLEKPVTLDALSIRVRTALGNGGNGR